MATQTVRAMNIAWSPYPYSWESYEAEESSHKIGAILVWTASGMVREAEPDSDGIVGLALQAGQDKSGSGNVVKTLFAPLVPGTIVEGNLVGSATETSLVVRATGVGTLVGIIKRTTTGTPWAFDWNEVAQANLRFRIVGIRDASGDVNGRVYAVVVASHTAWAGSNPATAD